MVLENIVVDITQRNYNTLQTIQYDVDSRYVNVKIVNNGKNVDLTNYMVSIACKKPDGKIVFNETEMIEPKQGLIKFLISEQISSTLGEVVCELKIYGKNSSVLTTQYFTINVTKPIADKSIQSTNEFRQLTVAMNEYNKWIGEVQDKYVNLEKEYASDLAGVKSTLVTVRENCSKDIADFQQTLNTAIVNQDADIDAIKTQMITTDEQLTQKIEVEKKRIDSLSSLTQGSTTGDAELKDVRIGIDGKVYENAGNAVRGQVNLLQSEIENTTSMLSDNVLNICNPQSIFSFQVENFVDGYWLNKYTPEAYQGWGYTKNFIIVKPNSTLYFRKTETKDHHSNVVGASSIYVTEYDLSGGFIKQVATASSSGCVLTTSNNCHFIRLSMSLADLKRDIRYYIGYKDVTAITDNYKQGSYVEDKMTHSLSQMRFMQMSSPSVLVTTKTPIYIYPNNLLLNDNSFNVNFYLDDRTPLKQQKKRLYSETGYGTIKQYQLTAVVGNEPRSYYLYDNCFLRDVTIAINGIDSNSGSGVTKKVMFIGDSITAEGTYVKQVYDLFSSDVSNIQLIGTLGGETNKHEGRGGWSAKTYCTQKSYNGSTNAFLNPATNKFDFSYYMSQNSFSGIDIVFINLGINDLNENPYSDTNYANIINYYKQMISSIKAYNSNVKILCGLCILPANYEYNVSSLGQTDYVKKDRQLFIEQLQIGLKGMVTKFVPYFLCVDTENDFPTEKRAIDTYNTDLVEWCTDITHPKKSGYMKLGDMSYNYIKHLM